MRELENVIERAVLLGSGSEITHEILFLEHAGGENVFEPLRHALKAATERMEKERIMEATQQAKGIRSEAARLLGISRAAFYNKLKRYHLSH